MNGISPTEIVGLALDAVVIKKLTKLMPNNKAVSEMCRKIAFHHFLIQNGNNANKDNMICCKEVFKTINDLKKHVSIHHSDWISEYANDIETQFYDFFKGFENQEIFTEEYNINEYNATEKFVCSCNGNFKVTLYYLYTDIKSPSHESSWQRSICQHLKLIGKIRVASEGINGTAEGCECAINRYIVKMCERLTQLKREDFKLSNGDGNSFENLKVTECEELCSIGISPDKLKSTDGGKHLTPEEFHMEVQKKSDDTILLDCRNFYESKIGYFENALRPNLRKFSYFPAYVDKNHQLLKNKRVLMYCTGGIRCERASAYIIKSVNCKEVLQLKGGIHKYLEKYPDGHYKGKLFVFDERYSIGGEMKTPVSSCKYCNEPHDKYKLCTTKSCRQLVHSCDSCRTKGWTACCGVCQSLSDCETPNIRQECECTRSREQIPIEDLSFLS
ncbi:thiosulfate sulfurtransferase/rhodanese-like domain-containing protein 2 isoform X1 [Styela clava]